MITGGINKQMKLSNLFFLVSGLLLWIVPCSAGNIAYYDSQGNLDISLVRELMYCAQPVQRAIKTFGEHGILYSGDGRNIIDKTFLTGFWTPEGFEQNARLIAEEYSTL